MLNPILQMLNRPNQNGIQNLISAAKGNPEGMFNQLMNTNPRFSQFVRENQGKSAEQIAREHGIDQNVLNQFMK